VLVFSIVVFSCASFKDVYTSLFYVLENPNYPPISFIDSIVIYATSVFLKTKGDALLYACLGILFTIMIVDKKRKNHKLNYYIVASVLTFVLMVRFLYLNYINMLMWPINALGIFVFFLSNRKSNHSLFSTFWVLGILYSFCSSWASTQGLYAITSASAVAAVGSIMMIVTFTEEYLAEISIRQYKYLVTTIASVLIVTQLLSQTIWRYKSVFWEKGGMAAQTEYISEGVQSGIYASKEAVSEYNEMYELVERLRKYDAKSAVFITSDTRYYLYGEYNIGTFSAWLGERVPIALERLETYYDLNPQNLPDIGYIEPEHPDVDYVAFADRFAARYGYEWHYEADEIVLIKNHAIRGPYYKRGCKKSPQKRAACAVRYRLQIF